MSASHPLNHLRSIWYHSEPSDVPYSPNQFLGWAFFCRFLQQDSSKNINLFCSTSGSCATTAPSTGSNNTSGGLNLHHASDSSDSGCALEEYTWVPNGLRPQQVRHGSFHITHCNFTENSHWGVTNNAAE